MNDEKFPNIKHPTLEECRQTLVARWWKGANYISDEKMLQKIWEDQQGPGLYRKVDYINFWFTYHLAYSYLHPSIQT